MPLTLHNLIYLHYVKIYDKQHKYYQFVAIAIRKVLTIYIYSALDIIPTVCNNSYAQMHSYTVAICVSKE